MTVSCWAWFERFSPSFREADLCASGGGGGCTRAFFFMAEDGFHVAYVRRRQPYVPECFVLLQQVQHPQKRVLTT